MTLWTAIVLAGHRPGIDAFALAHGVTLKALIPIRGEPMVARVVRSLLACKSVGRIVVLGQDPEQVLDGAGFESEPRVSGMQGGPGISASVGEIAGSDAAPYPLLVTTADHALLRPEMVEGFLAAAGGADVAVGVVERRVVERAHPDTKRTWLTFRGGKYSGANLFALATPASARAVDVWAHVERDRKRTLKLLSFFGPLILLGAMTRTLTLARAARIVGRRFRLRLAMVPLPWPEAAIDVDKPEDLELVRRILAQGKE
jgi:GTP:adenosylcobinamide-phosphate guanylyltransferase